MDASALFGSVSSKFQVIYVLQWGSDLCGFLFVLRAVLFSSCDLEELRVLICQILLFVVVAL